MSAEAATEVGLESTKSVMPEIGIGIDFEVVRDTPTATGVQVEIGEEVVEDVSAAPVT